MMIKQDAGTKQLGDIAPKFAQLNDEVLFGEVWSREDKLSLRDRSLITVAALLTKGIVNHSIQYHLENAKNHGVSKTEMVEVITQLAFYAGWPNAWAVFPMVKKVYQDEKEILGDSLFGRGEPNVAFANYFTGKSYLKTLNTKNIGIYNVTFEPKCRNNWHIHHKGGQILLCTDGEGWYQEEGKQAIKLTPGSVVYIPAEVKHWHGASKDAWFTHLAIEIPADYATNEWCEPVDDETYNML
ncbi:MAG: cupin domain-containing protein [Bacilli bacterium]|nr:cupin domain-containing protein [Bacilli bacterium]